MKIRFFKWCHVLLTALLAVLGYSCKNDDYPVEYGAPSADYHLSGVVTDEAGNPVGGILVSVEETDYYNDYRDYLASKKSMLGTGEYWMSYTSYGNPDLTKIIVQDVDGEANGGEFANDTIDIDYDNAVKIKDGDGHWYYGAWKITQNIKLKKK